LYGGLKKNSIDDARKIQGCPNTVRNRRRLRFSGPKNGNLSQSFARGASPLDNKGKLKSFLLEDDGGDTERVALTSGKFGEKKRSFRDLFTKRNSKSPHGSPKIDPRGNKSVLTPTNTNFFFGLPSKPRAKLQKCNHSNSRDSLNLSKGHIPHSHSLYQFPPPLPNLHLRSQLRVILNKSPINGTLPTAQNPQFPQTSKKILNLSYQQNSRSSPKFTPAPYENSVKSTNSQLPLIGRNVFFSE
jgi:hypothetical protein